MSWKLTFSMVMSVGWPPRAPFIWLLLPWVGPQPPIAHCAQSPESPPFHVKPLTVPLIVTEALQYVPLTPLNDSRCQGLFGWQYAFTSFQVTFVELTTVTLPRENPTACPTRSPCRITLASPLIDESPSKAANAPGGISNVTGEAGLQF